jgi:hypothetical protein
MMTQVMAEAGHAGHVILTVINFIYLLQIANAFKGRLTVIAIALLNSISTLGQHHHNAIEHLSISITDLLPSLLLLPGAP